MDANIASYSLRRGGSIRIVQKGNRGDGVLDVQKKLASLGYDVGPNDSKFGRKTEAAVRQFQQDHGLRLVDGRVGPETIGALKAATIPLPHLRPEVPPAEGTSEGISGTPAIDMQPDLKMRQALPRGGIAAPPPVQDRTRPDMRFYDQGMWGPQTNSDPALADAMLRRGSQATLSAPQQAEPPTDFSIAAPASPRPVGSGLPGGLDTSIAQHNADLGLQKGLDAKIHNLRDSAIRFDPAGGNPSGLLSSPVAGRTDRLPIAVPKDSYVVPADIVSGLGQGNTDAGAGILDKIFQMHMHSGMRRGGVPNAPDHKPVDIVAAGGEYVVDPTAVRSIGGGDYTKGHRTLDKMVLGIRKQTAARLRALPGPKK